MNVKQVGVREFIEYRSLAEFYEYITSTSLNETFSWGRLSSVDNDYSFSQTYTFEEATQLFKNGWQDMSEKLNQRLKVELGKMEKVMVAKNTLSVQGYQPIVPLYLNGIPANMISKQMKPMKQKVITLNKSITYSGAVSTEKMVEEGIKALAIVKKLENQHYRCNLNIILGTEEYSKGYTIKVRIKSANERLNINKLTFPLVHPSMLRRLFFRFIEVYPGVPSSFRCGYGRPTEPRYLREAFPDEILLPQFIFKDVKKINMLDDLEKLDRI